jgi:diguanylate cyclase (GGDEF)-like protein
MVRIMVPRHHDRGFDVEADFRARTVAAGVVISWVLSSCGIVYALLAGREGHRWTIAAVVALGAAAASLVRLLPAGRIVRSRWCEPFFLGWSFAVLTVIFVSAALDGGVRSPMAVATFVPVIFSGLSYPFRSTLAVGVATIGAALGLGLAAEHAAPGYTFFFCTTLACTVAMCVWQSRLHESVRDHLSHVSRTDPLTGCLNRRGFAERFDAELADVQRSGAPLGLLVVDLDRFKEVNDTLGHAAGDELLCWVATTLAGVIRPRDAVGRLGGDEFALLLPGAGAAACEGTAGRVQGALAERVPASFGIAAHPGDGHDREAIQRRADADLYARKHSARTMRESAAAVPRLDELPA